MNAEDLRSLAERAATIEGRQADRLAEVHGRIRTAQRRRAAAAGACVASLVLALVFGVSALTGSRERGQEPVEPPTPMPTETIGIPDDQATYTADIRPGDIQGWETIGSRTNTEPDFLGDTELSMTVTLRTYQDGISVFCQGNPDTWYALSYGDGGRSWGQCSPDDSLPVVPEFQSIGPYTDANEPREIQIRMLVTKPTQKWVDCYTAGQVDCEAVLPPLQPLDSTDAQFGFVVHEHPPAPSVLEVLGTSFEALVMTNQGKQYLVNKAILAAGDASTLVVHLDRSDRASIVAVYTTETPGTNQCRERYDTEGVLKNPELSGRAALDRLNRRCVPEVLRVDGGQPVAPRAGLDGLGGDFGVLATIVPAGRAHELTVNVVKNDPRNVRFAVVIWQARS